MESRVEQILEPLPRSDPEATALRIELKLEHGRVDEAMAMLQDAPADDPHLARIRGRVALMRGDHAAAIRHFQDALSEEPYDRVSLSELGKALLLKGDPSAEQLPGPRPGASTTCTTYSAGSAGLTGKTKLPT